jgi:alcohol/geraniol dehydrogenase (NADP+)
MALKFANAWGCEVTSFTSPDSEADEARSFGARNIVSSRKDDDLKKIVGSFDLLLVTVNVPLNWPAMIATLRPAPIVRNRRRIVMKFALCVWRRFCRRIR